MQPVTPARFSVQIGRTRTASVTLRHHAEGAPLPRREQWARQGRSLESLTPRPGIREHNRPKADFPIRPLDVGFRGRSDMPFGRAAGRAARLPSLTLSV